MRWNALTRGVVVRIAALATAALATPAAAQTTGGDGWHFSVTPYVWMAAIEGEVAAFSNAPEVDVDLSFSDILDHMDLTLMVTLEARYGRFGVLADTVYLDISADENTPGPLFGGVDLEQTSVFSTIAAFYRVIDRETFRIDVLPGMRVWYVDTELDFDPGILAGFRVDQDETWVDPVIGTRGNVTLGHGFGINGYADYGGFGAASERTWQLVGTLDWTARDWLVLRAGYRHVDVDYKHSGFEFDVDMTGPVIGASIRF